MEGPLPTDLVPCWERFLAVPERLKLDPISGICEAVFADDLLFPLQRQREMAAMLSLAASRSPKVVAEIGADKGGSVLSWCLLSGVERIIACEERGTPYCDQFEEAFPRLDFCWLPGSSRAPDELKYLRRWLLKRLPVAIDVLFLDGDKTAFVQDFDAWKSLMSPSGLVLMHDVTDGAPGDAFVTIKRRGYVCREIIDRTDSGHAVARQEQGIPPAGSHESWLRHWRGKSCGVGVIELG